MNVSGEILILKSTDLDFFQWPGVSILAFSLIIFSFLLIQKSWPQVAFHIFLELLQFFKLTSMKRKDEPVIEYVLKIRKVSWINHNHEVN